ncbi:MAG: pyridoxamine 5'-phosphate oxidase family protein [Alphaproteobacteria bacterium]|nr:pyridoxamine 5'-phosphate oxidase family protein [Alphaproteobacteria bacterium]
MTADGNDTGAAPDHYSDLDAVLETAWALLEAGVADRAAAAHTPVLASVDAGGAPQARTVVLRGCDRAARQLRIHTDRRSDKVDDLRANPNAVLHVYAPSEKIQLRLHADASLHTDDRVAVRAWEATRWFSRICYQVTKAPGARLDDPGDVAFDADATNEGAEHFMVVRLQVTTLEWLYLDRRGHRRARFSWSGEGWSGEWLVP